MKREFYLPESVVFVELRDIANHVRGVVLETIEPISAKTCLCTGDSNEIPICHGKKIAFFKEIIKGFDIVPVTHAGSTFYAATIEFYGANESLRYGIIISPRSALGWLRHSAEELGKLFSRPPLDFTRTSQQDFGG